MGARLQSITSVQWPFTRLPGLWLFLPASFFLGEFFLVFLPDFFADFLAECLADFLAESLLLRVPFLELREGLPPI